MHEFKIMTGKKVFIADIQGSINMDEGTKIMEEYKQQLQKIKSEEYIFILNGKTVTPSSLIVFPLIQKFITLCYNTPFKKFFFIGSEMQNSYARSMMSSYNTKNKDIKLVNSLDEVLKQI